MAESKRDTPSSLTMIALGVYLVLDIISIACTFSFRDQYDETDSSMPSVALSAIFAGFFGHLIIFASGYICCGAICSIFCGSRGNFEFNMSQSQDDCDVCFNTCESCCDGCAYITIKGGTILSSVWIGLTHLSATISMAIVTAENPAANVQAFGGFITAINAIGILLSIPYCGFITVCDPLICYKDSA